jgi:hypothetical protein
MNETVAYINKDDGLVCAKCYKPFTRELTDEEITKLHLECWDEIEFARAILRKAQE